MSDHEMEAEIGVVGLEDDDAQDARNVSSDKNTWRCPSSDPSQLFVHRERHISHIPLSGTIIPSP